jgi:hypothetical protein
MPPPFLAWPLRCPLLLRKVEHYFYLFGTFPAPRDFHECGAVFLFLRPVDLHQKRKKKKVEHYQQKPMLNFCSLVYCLEIRKERRLSAVPHV